MASGRIIKDLHTFNTGKYFQPTQAQNFEYTGLSVTIPPHCIFAMSAVSQYNNNPPDKIAISNSSTDAYNWNLYDKSVDGANGCSFCGYNNNDWGEIFYVWVRGTGNNTVILHGFYRYVD